MIRHLAEYVVFRLMACVLQMLTLRQTIWLAEGLAWIALRLPAKWTRRQVAAENLRQALHPLSDAEVDRLFFQMWVHLFRLVAETVQWPRKLTLTNCRDVIVFRQRQLALQCLATGRPVFFLGGHFGNWELATAAFGLFGFPMGIIAREMDNPYLHDWFVQSRQHTGHKLYLKRGSWNEMTGLLAAGGNLGLLCDQDAGRRGVFVDFFGKPASTFRSIALMALEYDALIVVGYALRLPDHPDARWARYEIGCETVIDPREIRADDQVQAITARFTSALQTSIERAPEQYFWVHRRWKTDPETRRKTSKIKDEAARP